MTARFSALLLAASLAVAPSLAQAVAHDIPTVQMLEVSPVKLTLQVTAGATGAPGGFSMYWMTQLDYDDYGQIWPAQITYPTLHWANFTGAPTLNTFDGVYTTYQLGPNQSIIIEIGDLADESGLTTNTAEELDMSVDFVLCAFANAGGGYTKSDYSTNAYGATITNALDCVLSQGYWKTHPDAWPIAGMTLGTVAYTKAELLQIMNWPTGGNGLVSLAHQFIALKLNIAMGADPTPVSAEIAAAEALIGALVVPPIGGGFLAPASTSSLTQAFDDFNVGATETKCHSTAVKTSTWGRLKQLYR